MILNRSTSDFKKRNKDFNSLSPLRNQDGHIALK